MAVALTIESGAICASFLALAVVVVVELVKLKGQPAKCWLVKRGVASWQAVRNLWRRGKEGGAEDHSARRVRGRQPGQLIGRFPVTTVATVLLLVSGAFTAIYDWSLFKASSTVEFSATFDQGNPAVTGPRTAAPSVESEVSASVTLKPRGQRLTEAAVIISGPVTITLSDCHVQGEKGEVGFARGAQARVGLEDVRATDPVKVKCKITVVQRIRRIETVTFELTGAGPAETEKEVLYLLPPYAERGRETAEAQADKEIRTSPALWQESSMEPSKDGFREQGIEWPQLDPRALHGFGSEPAGRARTLRQLQSTRIEPSKIETVNALITSPPVTQDRFTAKGSERRAVRQVFAIGEKPAEQSGWCSTTRSTAQPPLRKGQHVTVRAAVVEWGKSESSGGISVMLDCPAVRARGAVGAAVKTEAGAGAVPDRVNH
jgi:hypothetical protein